MASHVVWAGLNVVTGSNSLNVSDWLEELPDADCEEIKIWKSQSHS